MASSSGHVREIARIKVGPATWFIYSDCGVVKITSAHHGCMAALSPSAARHLSVALAGALVEAADSVDSASSGGPR